MLEPCSIASSRKSNGRTHRPTSVTAMIERLNFYDVYGYLLPGSFLLFLLWLPFGIVTGAWPPGEVTSALIAVVIAYITGHLLQGLIREVLPSDLPPARRYPSS